MSQNIAFTSLRPKSKQCLLIGGTHLYSIKADNENKSVNRIEIESTIIVAYVSTRHRTHKRNYAAKKRGNVKQWMQKRDLVKSCLHLQEKKTKII